MEMNTNSRRRFLERASVALLAAPLAWVSSNDWSLFSQAHAAALPRGWKKANARMGHNMASLYIHGKKGWFDKGLEAGRTWTNSKTGDEFEFVAHGAVSKKWVLVRSSAYKSYFLVFRGTQTERKEDIAADLSNSGVLLPKRLGGNSEIIIDPTAYRVPSGFLIYWSALRKEIDKLVIPELRKSKWDVRVSGFSLGGVFALYAAWYLRKVKKVPKPRSVYTFGAPACANVPFSEALGKHIRPIFRVYADDDPVPGASFAGAVATSRLWFFPGKPIAIGRGGGKGHEIEKYQAKIAKYL